MHDSCGNMSESASTTATDSEADSSYRSITTNSMSISTTEVNGRGKMQVSLNL